MNRNWRVFVRRLGVNAVRMFARVQDKLDGLIKTERSWGRALDGTLVRDTATFASAVDTLRSSWQSGASAANNWTYPVNWSYIFDECARTNVHTPGTDEYAIHELRHALGIEHIVLVIKLAFRGCHTVNGRGGAPRYERHGPYHLRSFDRSASEYWSERWAIYKLSYALAIWSRHMLVENVEINNEPDRLGAMPTHAEYVEYVKVRSLATQHAYDDVNKHVGHVLQLKVVCGEKFNNFFAELEYRPKNFKNNSFQ